MLNETDYLKTDYCTLYDGFLNFCEIIDVEFGRVLDNPLKYIEINKKYEIVDYGTSHFNHIDTNFSCPIIIGRHNKTIMLYYNSHRRCVSENYILIYDNIGSK